MDAYPIIVFTIPTSINRKNELILMPKMQQNIGHQEEASVIFPREGVSLQKLLERKLDSQFDNALSQ